jgi:signal transduction histidine kinase
LAPGAGPDRLARRSGDSLDAQGLDYLARMQNAAARMQSLIQDLLTFSRVSSHGRQAEAVTLDSVAPEIVADLQGRIESSAGVVELGPLPAVKADPTQMRQLLQNLVGNALKFHHPGVAPRLRVPAEPADDGWVTLHVEDSGVGFDMK